VWELLQSSQNEVFSRQLSCQGEVIEEVRRRYLLWLWSSAQLFSVHSAEKYWGLRSEELLISREEA